MPSRRTDIDKETSMDRTWHQLGFTLTAAISHVSLYMHRNEYSIMLKLPSKSQCDFAKAAEGSSFKLSNSQMASSKTSFARKGSYLGTRTPSEMPHLCSPPTLFVAARDRHRSAHAAKQVDVAAAQALRRHRSFHRRNSSLRWWSLLLLRRRQCLSLRPPHSSSLRCRGSRLPNARVNHSHAKYLKHKIGCNGLFNSTKLNDTGLLTLSKAVSLAPSAP
nr:hypothetical protein Iba_chr06dCG7660 [Ipomoea batatas]